MSKINGEKARASIERRRRTAQRSKDRSRLAEIAQASAAKPAAEKPAATKPAAKKKTASSAK
ncbi:MAG: hypothetical protein QOG73_1308 [Acetobacteraceae bacterium]|jgi:hypothetical protein|nr:hypothetical protein [Acetobacteraceae bacterium]